MAAKTASQDNSLSSQSVKHLLKTKDYAKKHQNSIKTAKKAGAAVYNGAKNTVKWTARLIKAIFNPIVAKTTLIVVIGLLLVVSLIGAVSVVLSKTPSFYFIAERHERDLMDLYITELDLKFNREVYTYVFAEADEEAKKTTKLFLVQKCLLKMLKLRIGMI